MDLYWIVNAAIAVLLHCTKDAVFGAHLTPDLSAEALQVFLKDVCFIRTSNRSADSLCRTNVTLVRGRNMPQIMFADCLLYDSHVRSRFANAVQPPMR